MKLFCDLTDCGQYFLDIISNPEAGTLVAKFRPGNPVLASKNLEENLKHLLKIEIDGRAYDISNGSVNGSMTWQVGSTAIANVKIYIRNMLFGEYEADLADTDAFVLKHADYLAPFEIRTLARGIDSAIASQVPYDRSKLTSFKPKTDLHTHFSGNITADDLVAVASKNGTQYPVGLLQELGLRQNEARSTIPVAELRPEEINRLKAEMAIPIDQQTTFTHMERIYRFRSPITKDINNFGYFLRAVALQYRKQGIGYAELSISDIVDPRYLKIAHDVLPDIERETGVQLRFLVGLWRHSDPEWNRYEVERIKLTAERSPYIVGVDWMGQETNSTHAIADSFERLAEWAQKNNPNFIFRVHAGENPFHAENVAVAARLAKKYGVRLRIGHGLYGVDRETMDLLAEIDAIIEFNMNSNLALNNLDAPNVIPIKKYLDHRIQIVLGQDGQGIYHTSGRSEVLAASLAGLTADGFALIARTEGSYRQEQAAIFERRSHLPLAFVIPSLDEYPSRADADRQSTANAEAAKRRRAELERRIGEIGAVFDPAAVENDTKGKTPIWLGLASVSSWPKISPEHQAEIVRTLEMLVQCVDPTKTYFITGGENIGSAKIFHHLANTRRDEGLIAKGDTVEESRPEDFQPGTVTHAAIVARSWYDKAAKVADEVRRGDGEAIFFGGGAIVGDEITTAANVGIGLHLMAGPIGASSQKARVFPNLAFRTTEMLMTRLHDANPELFDKVRIDAVLSGAVAAATASLPEFTVEEFDGLHADGRLGRSFEVSQIFGSPRPIFFLNRPMTLHAHDANGNFDNTRALSSGSIIVFGGAQKIAPLAKEISQLIETGEAGTPEFQRAFVQLKDALSKQGNFYEYGDEGKTADAKLTQLARATLGGEQTLAEGKKLSGFPIEGLSVTPERWGKYFDDLAMHFAESWFIERTLPPVERLDIARGFLTQALNETRSYPRGLPPEATRQTAYRFDKPIKVGEYHIPAGSWAVMVRDNDNRLTEVRPVSACHNGLIYVVRSGDPYYVNYGENIRPARNEAAATPPFRAASI